MRIVYISSNYRNGIYKAVLSIILGLVLIIWPGQQFLELIIRIIGLLFLISGVASLATSYRNREDRRKWYPINGAGSIILGLLLIGIPGFFTTIFLFTLGFILIVAAVGQFISLNAARQFGHVSWIRYLFPIIIMAAGIIIFWNAMNDTLLKAMSILFGATIIFYGVTELVNLFAINKMRKTNERKEQITKMNGNPDIQEVDYEEVN